MVGSCDNALKAKIYLQKEKVDVLFLDINMPVLDGISFLKTMKHPPKVIFTTAYKEYALEAFELTAVDYLLKPFSLERFIMAVDKATEQLQGPAALAADVTGSNQYCFIRTDGKICKLLFSDVIYVEASGNYTRIVTAQQTLMPAMSFSTVAAMLPAGAFLRVHRSFIINQSEIDHIEGNRVYMGQVEIPIGSNYKDDFMKALGFR